MLEAGPTVIVVRRVLVGMERQFENWNGRLVAAAGNFQGYVGSEIQAPNDAHPQEWVNIYRFDRQENLDRWLESDQRGSLMREGSEFLDGPTREQRIAQADPEADVVTAVMSKRIRPGVEDDYARAQVGITQAMSQFPGFIRSQVFEPVPGIQDAHVTVFTFESRTKLDKWLESDERHLALAEVEPYLDGANTLSVVGGFGGWFATEAPFTPPKWKQATTVLIALFPMTLTLSLIQGWFAPDVPWVPALFVSNVVGVAILTWILMPLVTTLLRPWLSHA